MCAAKRSVPPEAEAAEPGQKKASARRGTGASGTGTRRAAAKASIEAEAPEKKAESPAKKAKTPTKKAGTSAKKTEAPTRKARALLLFSHTTIDFIRRKILLHISTRINVSLISDFFIKLMKLPMKFFDTKLTGDLLQRIEDHRRIENFLTNQTISIVFSVFTFMIFSIVLFVYHLPIFTVFIAGSILYGLWIRIFLKKRRLLNYKMFEQQGMNRNVVYQLITG